jgi:hypothetical protein
LRFGVCRPTSYTGSTAVVDRHPSAPWRASLATRLGGKVSKGIVRTVNIPAVAGAQTIVLPTVFTDAEGLDHPTRIEVLRLPDVGPLWMSLHGTAVIDGDDTYLNPEGAPWNAWPIGNMRDRMAQRPHRPDMHISVIYGQAPAVAGFVEFTLY